MSSLKKENTIHLPLYLWEIKSQSGCKGSQPKRHADCVCDHQTDCRLNSKIQKSQEEIQKDPKN